MGIARSGLASSELGLSKKDGTMMRMGLNKIGLSKKRKEVRGKYYSPLCVRDEYSDLTDEDVLGLSSGGVSEAVLELSLTFSLRVCSLEIK